MSKGIFHTIGTASEFLTLGSKFRRVGVKFTVTLNGKCQMVQSIPGLYDCALTIKMYLYCCTNICTKITLHISNRGKVQQTICNIQNNRDRNKFFAGMPGKICTLSLFLCSVFFVSFFFLFGGAEFVGVWSI